MAVRLARAFTGKKKILKFEGQYHGWYDGLLANCHVRPIDSFGTKMDPVKIVEGSGIPLEHIDNLIICPWNDLEVLEKTVKRHKDELAAILTEPIMANVGVIPPKEGYLEGLQRILIVCRRKDNRAIDTGVVKNLKRRAIRQMNIHKNDIRCRIGLKPRHTVGHTVEYRNYLHLRINLLQQCRQIAYRGFFILND